MKLAWLAWPAAALLAAPALAAECTLDARSADPLVQRSYDPFAFGNTVLDITVKVRNISGRTCQARVYLLPNSGALALLGPRDRLNFRFDGFTGAGRARAGEFGPFVAQVRSGDSETVPIRLTIPAQQVVGSGSYRALFDLRVEDGQGDPVPLSGGTVAAVAQVPARAEMSISGTAMSDFSAAGLAPANIAFGEARTGATQKLFVNVWTNEAVAITLSSENRGRLLLVGREALSPIDYSARFDGVPLGLASTQTLRRTPLRSVNGTSYELALTLGDVSKRYGGVYRDRITVSVTAD